MRSSRFSLLLGCVLLCSASLLYLGMSGIECPPKSRRHRWMELNLGSANPNLSLNFPEDTPLIFIGGFPQSGTTLMRVMLDAHRHVRCGEETRVMPRLLTMRATWSHSVKERLRLDEAGVTDQVLDSAVRAFLLEVSCYHGYPRPPLPPLSGLRGETPTCVPGDRRPRGARAAPLQQGPVRPEVAVVRVPDLPQGQVRADAARRPGRRSLHDST